ncbi:MAG TPA: MFS transporter, partial [Candidatus Binatia bacterium]|nr:MFS transporter [Candidatus Binatia bacterium]
MDGARRRCTSGTGRSPLVVHAAGSGLTALSPSVVVLFLGWSVLEGLGDALIMPTVTALVAGNFTGQQRARAYGLIAASAAVAVAAGPIIGGFVTANFSWRWVFAAEVLIAFGILIGSGRIPGPTHPVPGVQRPVLYRPAVLVDRARPRRVRHGHPDAAAVAG